MKKTAIILLYFLILGGSAAAVAIGARHWARSRPSHATAAAPETFGSQNGKQLWTCGMHPQVVQDHPGDCPICHMHLTPMRSGATGNGGQGHDRKILYWWDPMLGPPSIADKPGKSAMGMDRVPVYADEAGPRVTIDPSVVQNMGVRTAEVTRGPLAKTVRTVGVIRLPETGLHDVSLKVGGWIDKLYADQEGMHVAKDEPLFELYSQDLQVAEEELITAVRAARALDPAAHEVVREEAEGLVTSAKRKLKLWDVADAEIEAIAKADQPPRTIVFRSPAMGHVEDKMIVQGTAVQPGMKLMRIADHSRMWLEVQVYEEQISVVALGQMVEAAIDGIPGNTFKGEITFMYPHIDHTTRTLTVRATLDNPGFELKPGMYATANIAAKPMPDVIQVPREAVIDTGTRQIAFVAQGNGHFDPRKVKMGMVGDDDRVQIIEGLAPGEIVVTSGQFLMDVESRTTEAIEKLRQSSTPRNEPATP